MKTTKVDVDLSDKTNKELADKSDLSQHPLLIQCEQDYNAIIEAASLSLLLNFIIFLIHVIAFYIDFFVL